VLLFLCAALLVVATWGTAHALLAWIVGLMLLIRCTVQLVILGKATRKLQEHGISLWLLIYDVLSPILAFIVTMAQPNLQKIKKVK
jgi:hypothetical protein